MFNMGIFCSCSKLQENENNLIAYFCTFCHDQFQGLERQGLKCVECKLHINKNFHQLGKNNYTNDSVVSGDTEGDCQTSSSTLCSDTALVDIKGFSDQNDVIDQPADSVPIEHPEGDAEVGVSCQYSIDDFKLMKVIGRGSYSKVLIVEHKRNQNFYAMKVMEKERVARDEDMSWVEEEKNVFIAVANYPFFVALQCCFQTASRLFFVMEFVPGGDLLYFMGRKKKLPEDHARFYAAEISLALNFLHTRGIIYRDLKLENVLIDHEGHIKLTDYGLCKKLKWPGKKTYKFCGTPNYMAPEILNKKFYGFSVDWWALGIVLHEMLLGKCPFNITRENSGDNNYLYNAILNNELRIPESLSEGAASVLKGLLVKNPVYRLGYHPYSGFRDIKGHLFFESIDWKMLEQKRVSPHYIPQLNSDCDLTNFSPKFTKEPINFTPDDHDAIVQLEFEGFEYVNPYYFNASKKQ